MIDSLLNVKNPDFKRREHTERLGRICQLADSESKSITHNLEIWLVCALSSWISVLNDSRYKKITSWSPTNLINPRIYQQGVFLKFHQNSLNGFSDFLNILAGYEFIWLGWCSQFKYSHSIFRIFQEEYLTGYLSKWQLQTKITVVKVKVQFLNYFILRVFAQFIFM